jgi:two-component system, sensor histidine kinase and response regulator
VPMVALTASAFEEDRAAILEAGCNDMVRKPVAEDRLFGVIGPLLGLRFEYAEALPEDGGEEGAGEMGLQELPAETRRRLAEAAVRLDPEAILALVADLRNDHPGEAACIQRLAGGFRFDRIQALCELADAPSGPER